MAISGKYQSSIYSDDSGFSAVQRVAGKLQKSDDDGQTFGDLGGPLDGPQSALNTLYALTGIDPSRAQSFKHVFDNLAGWTVESLNTGTGATGATTPLPVVAEWDGKACIQSAGTDSLSRGFVTNIGGTFANRNPRTGLLDQVTPWGVAAQIQVKVNDSGYCLIGMSDPTSVGAGPKGVYVGYEPGTNARFFEGYKSNAGGGGGVDTAPSRVQADGDYHIVYVFADASGFYKFSVDGETPIPLPNVNTFSNLLGCVRIALAGSSARVSWCTAIWPGST
jgi:hypothetical protein